MADQGAEGLLSPFLRRKRIAAVQPYLRGRVLDVGCGSGALAEWIEPEKYCGVDIDEDSRVKAAARFPLHRFDKVLLHVSEKFDTIVLLAVIEHIKHAGEFLRQLALRMAPDAEARVICTTPHPTIGWVHALGAIIGFFSRHASEEHECLLNCAALVEMSGKADLVMVEYKRFLWGVNQLAVFKAKDVA